MAGANSGAGEVIDFFTNKDNGEQIPSSVAFRGLTLKNRPAYEMICDCCGSGNDCCGFG